MRTSLLGLLSLALAGPAFAASELQLDANMPVVLYLDGESRGTVQPHEPLLVDIEPGVHNLRIQGILGKDLYDRDLIFDDDTRTELVWQRKQLRLGQVVKLDPNRPPPQAEGGLLPAVPKHPQAPDAPPPEPEVEEVAQAEQPLARPARPEKPARAPAPPAREKEQVAKAPPAPAPPAPVLANTAPPVREVKAPAPVPTTKGNGAVLIEAREGLDLQIAHGSQLLKVTVENGELIVVDANGTEIRFSGDGQAW